MFRRAEGGCGLMRYRFTMTSGLLVVVSLVLAACGGDDDGGAASPSPTNSSSSSSSSNATSEPESSTTTPDDGCTAERKGGTLTMIAAPVLTNGVDPTLALGAQRGYTENVAFYDTL